MGHFEADFEKKKKRENLGLTFTCETDIIKKLVAE